MYVNKRESRSNIEKGNGSTSDVQAPGESGGSVRIRIKTCYSQPWLIFYNIKPKEKEEKNKGLNLSLRSGIC
jgi:hypothetical protein